MPVLKSTLDTTDETVPGQPPGPTGGAGGTGAATRPGPGGRWREVRAAAPRARPAAGARAAGTAARPGHPLPGTVLARGLGEPVHCRGQHPHRDRRGQRRRVHDHRARPDRARRCDEPVHPEKEPAGPGHRPGQPAARDLPGRVRRSRPAHPVGAVRRCRQDLPEAHPALGRPHPDHRAGVRQLHRGRRLRARHVRLRGAGGRAGQGVPRRAAAGEDGHRRGRRRRAARRRADALRGVRPQRPVRRRRT